MIVQSAHTVLLNQEPIRKSWWKFEVVSSPLGEPMPEDRDVEIRRVPQLIDRSGTASVSGVNSLLTIPSMKEATAGSFGFQLYSDTRLLRWWREWRNLVYNPLTDEVGLYGDVVGQGVLTLYSAAENCGSRPEPALVVRLQDMWPSAVTLDAMAQEDDGGPVEYEIELQIAAIQFA